METGSFILATKGGNGKRTLGHPKRTVHFTCLEKSNAKWTIVLFDLDLKANYGHGLVFPATLDPKLTPGDACDPPSLVSFTAPPYVAHDAT